MPPLIYTTRKKELYLRNIDDEAATRKVTSKRKDILRIYVNYIITLHSRHPTI